MLHLQNVVEGEVERPETG